MLFDNWEEFIPAPGASMWSLSTLPRPDWDISENSTTAAAETRESGADWNIGGEEFIIIADPADDGTAMPFAMVKDSGTGPQFTEPESEPIVVTGKRKAGGGVLFSDPFLPVEVVPPDDSGSVPSPGEEPALSDDDGVDVTINATNLTPEQQQAVKDYLKAIDATDKAIRALADDAKIRLFDGSIVTGAELKSLWMKTDFVINPQNTPYLNGTERGEANYNGGNPVISQNINIVVDYGRHFAAGLNYLVLHEIGHLTAANRSFDAVTSNPQEAVERMANDIGRAIAQSNGLQFLPAHVPGSDDGMPVYSTSSPLAFAVENPGS